jgi:glycosyltransferase involved in cell wall biosynthesis
MKYAARGSMTNRIVIDGHNLTLSNATGIGTYARTLAATAAKIGFKPEVLLGGNARIDRRDLQLSEIRLFDAPTALGHSAKSNLQLMWARLWGKPFGIRPVEIPLSGNVFGSSASSLSGFDRIHAATNLFDLARLHFHRHGVRAEVKLPSPPSLFHMTFLTPLKTRGCPNIYTIHDIVPLRLPQTTLDDKKQFLRLVRHICGKADHIVTVSEFSRQDIVKFVGISENRITNTYQSIYLPPTITERSDDDVANEVANAFGLDFRGYYLFFGAVEPKKNIARLIDAYAASGSEFPLIIVGDLGWQYDDVVEKIEDERFLFYRSEVDRLVPSRRVRRLPHLPFSQLMTLVKGARGVLFPSLYEGFGLPVLEAMALGTPVITSNVASLPEVSGGAAVLIEPTDVQSISDAIRVFDHDDGLRADLALRGKKRAAFFSPEAYENRIAGLYQKLGVHTVPAQGSGAPLRTPQTTAS